MQETSKIKLAMLAQRMSTEAINNSMQLGGEDVVPLYPKTLTSWADEILKIVNNELELQSKPKKRKKE